MADEILNAPAPAAAPEPMLEVNNAPPAAPIPAAAPTAVPEASPAPAPAETAAPAASVAPAVTEAAKPHTETETLLEAADKALKPEEKPGASPEPGATGAPEATGAPAISTYEAMRVPEGFVADAERMDNYTALLVKNGVAPQVGQELLDLHGKAMSAFVEQHAAQTSAEQHRIFGETRANWRKDVMADPQIGGAGHQTALNAIVRMRDLAVPPQDRKAFDDFLRITGAGDHPAFLRAMHNFARFFDEPPTPAVMGAPAPDRGGKPKMKSLRDIYNTNR